ncbi:tetratricopeptide repeat protein, partial [Phocaeicola vulgatus]|uniref:tetratricopeptide repeat protein n=1 Tax=Phocaeicola vulgatus TaxID=821 RepID=UPI0023B09983
MIDLAECYKLTGNSRRAANCYPEAIGVLNSLILKDSTNTKVLIDLAECYKLTGNSRRAANCYPEAIGVLNSLILKDSTN